MVEKQMKTFTAGDTKYIINDAEARAEVADLKSHIGNVEDLTTTDKTDTVSAINELADVVYVQMTEEVEAENIYDNGHTGVNLGFGTNSKFIASSTGKGFYVDVSDYQGEKILVKRDNVGTRLRGAFSEVVPEVDVTFTGRWDSTAFPGGANKEAVLTVPLTVNYLYILYYNSESDTITEEQALSGMKIAKFRDENIYSQRSEDIMLSWGSNDVLQDSESLYGFYIPVDLSVADYLSVERTNIGTRFRIAFTSEIPAAGVACLSNGNNDSVKQFCKRIPDNSRYAYIAYYSTQSDTITKEQALAGMEIKLFAVETTTVVTENASRITGKADKVSEATNGNFASLDGNGNLTDSGHKHSDYLPADQGIENAGKALVIDNDGYVVPSSASVSVDKTLTLADTAAESKAVGDQIFNKYSKNLYEQRSANSLMLSFDGASYGASDSLYGFYIPIDPSKGTTVTIQRGVAGKRFRVAASVDVPAVGVAYHGRQNDDTGNKIVFTGIQSTDRYLYIAYYSSTQDTRTEEELLTSMTIYYGTEYIVKDSRIEQLDREKNTKFINGSIDQNGNIVSDGKHIVSNFIRVNGRFGLCSPSDYVVEAYCYNNDGEYVGNHSTTNKISYFYHYGLIRVCIGASDESDINPDSVDFSDIKIPINRYSAAEYTKKMTYVLDAENNKSADVYAYIDEVVATHPSYVTKTFLCNEETGLPIYYYTLGTGAKKICLVTGQHGPGQGGDPRDSVLTVAKLAHDLIDGNFENSSFLKKLHDECTIMIFPVLNPYGFDNFSRYNSNNVDTNRDWQAKATYSVFYSKPVIETFNPIIAFDIHGLGGSPLDNMPNIEYDFGTYSSAYSDAINNLLLSYYEKSIGARTTTDPEHTRLGVVIRDEWNILGGLIELNWWHEIKKGFHDYQVESANYAMLVNAIKYFIAEYENETFEYEHTPNQNQY